MSVEQRLSELEERMIKLECNTPQPSNLPLAEIQVLSKVRIPVEELPEEVILKAMEEVLSELDQRFFLSSIDCWKH